MKRALFYVLAGLAAIGLVAAIWGVFVVTPMEESLFYSQKIFYFHVPNAFMLFAAVYVCGIASAGFLKTRKATWDDVALSAAELAVLFGAVVLITGSIWARAAWGVWWTWETRLTSSLLLWLFMLGYVLVRRFAGPGSERLAAGLSAFGMVAVPFIYMGVKEGDQHPRAKVVQTLDPSMKATFWGAVLTFALLFVVLMMVRVRAARDERALRELEDLALDKGVL